MGYELEMKIVDHGRGSQELLAIVLTSFIYLLPQEHIQVIMFAACAASFRPSKLHFGYRDAGEALRFAVDFALALAQIDPRGKRANGSRCLRRPRFLGLAEAGAQESICACSDEIRAPLNHGGRHSSDELQAIYVERFIFDGEENCDGPAGICNWKEMGPSRRVARASKGPTSLAARNATSGSEDSMRRQKREQTKPGTARGPAD